MTRWVTVYRRTGGSVNQGSVTGGQYAECYVGRLNSAETEVELVYTISTEGQTGVLDFLAKEAVEALNAAEDNT